MRPLPLVFDGAKGTMLLKFCRKDMLPSELNVDNPEIVADLHVKYLEAGSEVILTNTVAIDILWLNEETSRAKTICKKGIEIAEKCLVSFRSGTRRCIGALISAPYIVSSDKESYEKLVECIRWQINIHICCRRIRWIVFETITSLESLSLILHCIEDTILPMMRVPEIIFSFSTNSMGLLADGKSADDALRMIREKKLNHFFIGLNCGFSPQFLEKGLLPGMMYFSPSDDMINPDPERWAKETAVTALAHGIKKVGGCCNTTPAHIRALRSYLDHL